MIKKAAFNGEKHCPQFGKGFELRHETCILCPSNIRCAKSVDTTLIIAAFTSAISVYRNTNKANSSSNVHL